MERGMLMDKIWNSNITLFTVAEDLYVQKCDDIKQNFKRAIDEIQEIFEAKLEDANVKLKLYQDKVTEHAKELLAKERHLEEHSHRIKKLGNMER